MRCPWRAEFVDLPMHFGGFAQFEIDVISSHPHLKTFSTLLVGVYGVHLVAANFSILFLELNEFRLYTTELRLTIVLNF